MKNFSQRIVLAGAEYKQRMQNRIRDATDLTKYTTSAVLLLVLSSLLFCTLIFRTNTIYSFRDLDFFSGDRLAKLMKYNTTVTSLQEASNNVLGSIPGISGPMTIVGSGDGTSKCSTYDVYSYPKELYESFQPGGEMYNLLKTYKFHSAPGSVSLKSPNEGGIRVMCGLFQYLSTAKEYEPYGAEMACGIIANMFCESGGNVGFKEQRGNNCPGWPAGVEGVQDDNTLSLVKNLVDTGNPKVCGFGLCQYTSVDKLGAYYNYMLKYVQSGKKYRQEDMAAAELDYLITEAIPNAIQDDKNRKEGDAVWTTPQLAGESWVFIYEMPGYRRGGSSGQELARLRGNDAEKLWTVLQKYK